MSTLAEQVVEQLKTDMDNVYDAGYQKGLKEIGGLDVSKFGIQNEVKGANIVTCDYVNENEHNVEVKLSSDTVTDFSGVEVKIVGKNVVNFEKPCDISGRYYSWLVPKQENGFFTVSLIDKENGYDTTGLYLGLTGNGIDHANGVVWLLENGVVKKTEYCTNEDANKIFLYISTYGDDKEKVIKKIMERFYIQVELGEYKTDYEPCTEKTYTANSDGTVDGVTSISPVMNIICEGVDISAKYYQCPTVEYDRFWDNYQEFGRRTVYVDAFYGQGWTDKTFKPKYLIKPIGDSKRIFMTTYVSEINETVVDLTEATILSDAFYGSPRIKKVSISIPEATLLSYTFYSCLELEEVNIFDIRKDCNTSYCLGSCHKLKKVNLTGVIGDNFQVHQSAKLENESVQNIIDCLADLTGETSKTLSLHADVKAKLTEEQIATITSKNWTLA